MKLKYIIWVLLMLPILATAQRTYDGRAKRTGGVYKISKHKPTKDFTHLALIEDRQIYIAVETPEDLTGLNLRFPDLSKKIQNCLMPYFVSLFQYNAGYSTFFAIKPMSYYEEKGLQPDVILSTTVTKVSTSEYYAKSEPICYWSTDGAGNDYNCEYSSDLHYKSIAFEYITRVWDAISCDLLSVKHNKDYANFEYDVSRRFISNREDQFIMPQYLYMQPQYYKKMYSDQDMMLKGLDAMCNSAKADFYQQFLQPIFQYRRTARIGWRNRKRIPISRDVKPLKYYDYEKIY